MEALINPFWGTHEIPVGEARGWRLGSLRLWVRRGIAEWQVRHRYDSGPESAGDWSLAQPCGFPPDEGTLQRWAIHTDSTRITLRAVFPNRSVVLRPEQGFGLPPSQEALFFAGVPLSVRLETGGDGETPVLLGTVPTLVLSKTWFGTPLEGEAAYALETRAVRDWREASIRGWRALCPVRIRNLMPEPLDLQRVCLRVRHLSLFRGQSCLWSNEVAVVKSHSYSPTEVAYSTETPRHDGNAVRIEEPEVKPTEANLLVRSFHNLKNWVEW